MLNINQQKSSLVNVVKDLIGYRLSTMPAQGNTTIPSVIKARTAAPKPPFPYATVDHATLSKVGYSQSSQYLDVNENEVDEFDYIGRLTVQINGEDTDDVFGICEEFRSRLFTSKGKRIIKEHFETSRLLTTSDVLFFPSFLVTDYEESARLTLDFWMRSVFVDENNDVIDNVNIDGELYEDYEQVDPPLTINTIAP